MESHFFPFIEVFEQMSKTKNPRNWLDIFFMFFSQKKIEQRFGRVLNFVFFSTRNKCFGNSVKHLFLRIFLDPKNLAKLMRFFKKGCANN